MQSTSKRKRHVVNKCVIFSIGGGKYRLVVRVNFVAQRMWIK
ncbi:MAG: hypothetical protein HN366_10830 [Deltaproteobacteria bacterium]|nr:hypothetical protein [Deltaproteobacteria bacterium]